MRFQDVRTRYVRPPSFRQEDFKPLPYGSIWTFNPLEVIDVFRHYPIWREFCSLINPNYFSTTVTLLSVIGSMINESNRRRSVKWKSRNVSYIAVGYARKGEWGQFIYLKSYLSKGRKNEINPSVIPLILPQKILNIEREDERRVVLELMSSRKIKI